MKIQILGIACPECDQVLANVTDALAELEIDAAIERIEKPGTIKGMGVYVTPAVAINGEVMVAGQVPTVSEIRHLITEKTS
jgi:small redox-active disulfide protein 2